MNASQVRTDPALPAIVEATPPRLEARGIGLWIGERVVLDDVSLSVEDGEVFAILGPQGCGKTSLVRCIAGLRPPASGTVWLDGERVTARTRSLRARMGVVLQEPSLDPLLSAEENLLLAAALVGVRRREARQRAADLLAFMELEEQRHDPVEVLASGMRRRLDLARALIHSPALLLLDGPTDGLDLSSYEHFWRRLLALRRSNNLAIALTTHRADEAERADRVAVVDRGHVLACDTPQRLLELVSGDVVTVSAPRAEKLGDEIAEALGLPVARLPGRAVIHTPAGHELMARLVESFPPGRIDSISVRRPTLADAFLKLTGASLGAEVGVP